MTVWIARNGDGTLHAFSSEPTFCEGYVPVWDMWGTIPESEVKISDRLLRSLLPQDTDWDALYKTSIEVELKIERVKL